MKPARILTVAGSDSGGGAGIQADLKTIFRLGGYGMTAITSVTAQNTLGVFGIWPLPGEAVREQILAVQGDLGIDGAKCGMLGTAEATLAAAEGLRTLGGVPLVVDPVMRAKGGDRLLEEDAEEALIREILPLAALVTPNIPEAEALTGRSARTEEERKDAARAIHDLGPAAVLVKGGHLEGELMEDLLYDGESFHTFHHARIRTLHTHGTGCTLSAAIATGLGQGMPLLPAVQRAVRFVETGIRRAPGLGQGHGPLGHDAGMVPWI